MAYTTLNRVVESGKHGERTKNAGHVLQAMLDYDTNPEKTVTEASAGQTQADGFPSADESSSLRNLIEYDTNPAKTDIEAHSLDEFVDAVADAGVIRLVTGVNCIPQIAASQMMTVKRKFSKEDGTIAYHGWQSFNGWETTPETAHEIGVKLAKRLWGDRFQVVVSTHTNTENLHNHFAVNTVSFVDGKKFRRTKKDYAEMRRVSDELCREYGLTVIERSGGRQRDGDSYSSRQRDAKAAIDEAIKASSNVREFRELLTRKGYTVVADPKLSHWTVKRDDWGQSIRLDSRYGEEYSGERLVARITKYTDAVDKWRESKLTQRQREAKAAIDQAASLSSSVREFKDRLARMGYTVDLNPNHKYWTIRHDKWNRAMRMYRFGSEYTNERIAERISDAPDVERPFFQSPNNVPRKKKVRVCVGGSLSAATRRVGLSKLYLHYCYLLGIYPGGSNKRQRRRYSYVLAEDLQKLDDITAQTRLLSKNHIKTLGQLIEYKGAKSRELEQLVKRRRQLYGMIRSSDVETAGKAKAEIEAINRELSSVRQEIRCCDAIAERSADVRGKVAAVRKEESQARIETEARAADTSIDTNNNENKNHREESR